MHEHGQRRRIDSVEALTEVSDHLAFAHRLVRGVVADRERLAELTGRIRAVEERLRDDRWYLAVIGEFSSGKSTFINALLGGDVLPTSALRTTAAATRIEYGDSFTIEVRLRDDGIRYSYPSGRSRGANSPLGRALRRLAPEVEVPADTEKLLALVVRDERIASRLDALRVTLPAPALRDGLVIVDTPGTNAEAGHTDITAAVMREEADLAAVLTPATAPAPASLSEFLTEALDPSLRRRCTFLVTKMDHLDEEEVDDLLRYVRRRMARTLELPDLVVEGVAAEPVVRRALGRGLRGPEQQVWADAFPATVFRLREAMQRQRIVAISETLLTLLEELLDDLVGELSEARQRLDTEETHLHAARISDLPAFVREQYAIAEQALHAAAVRARQAVGAMPGQWRQFAVRTVEAQLQAASTAEAVQDVVRRRAPELIRAQLPPLGEVVQRSVTTALGEAADVAGQAVREAFQDEYAKLGTAGALPARPSVPVLADGQLTGVALDAYQDNVAGVTAELRAIRAPAAGGRIGAVIDQLLSGPGSAGGSGANGVDGSHVVPAQQTSHRGGVGGWMSRVADSFSGTDLTHVRNRARAELHHTFKTVAERLSHEITESIGAATAGYAASVHEQVDHYHAVYQRTVAELAEEYDRREKVLTTRRTLLEDAGRQTRQRRGAVNHRRTVLMQRQT